VRFLILVTGIGLILFAYLNWRYDLMRVTVKNVATRLFGAGGGALGAFAETRVARIYYGGFFSTFAVLVGAVFLMVALRIAN
jgi:hypothetical protein